MKSIFIIIPAYNEEKHIVKLLSDIGQLVLPVSIKVILVDDGSTDKTRLLAEKFYNRLEMDIIIHSENLGVPRSFYDGLSMAAKKAKDEDVISIIEADNTSNLKVVPIMVRKIDNGTDIVVASRYLKGGGYKNFPLIRLIGSYITNRTVSMLVNIKNVSDYTIFFRAYRAKTIKSAMAEYGTNLITTKTFASNLEILLKVRKYATHIDEVPLLYDYGNKENGSKMKKLKALNEYKELIIRKVKGNI